MNKFTAYLAIVHEVTGGRGRVSWDVDLRRWDPKLPNQRQREDAWMVVFHPEDGSEPITVEAHDGAAALAGLVVKLRLKARASSASRVRSA